MILVIGGTAEALDITDRLAEKYTVLYSTATSYGEELAKERNSFLTISGRRDLAGFLELFGEYPIRLVLDVSHPFATQVSKTLLEACKKAGLPYLRYERFDDFKGPSETVFFPSQEEACQYLYLKEGKILLTTGSKELQVWSDIEKDRLVIRVLPTSTILKKCEQLGYKPRQIIAAQGPFSLEENLAVIQRYEIDYIVLKDTSQRSGRDNKLLAAKLAGIIPVVILRSKIDGIHIVRNLKEIDKKIEEVLA